MPKTLTITARQAQFASWTMYLLIDIVVLNLFVEFTDTIVIDSFYMSVLTAILLRLLLGVTIYLEHRLSGYFARKTYRAAWAVGDICKFLVLFTSKFAILEVMNFVFGNHVTLGGFVEIVAVVVALIAAEFAIRTVFDVLGRQLNKAS